MVRGNSPRRKPAPTPITLSVLERVLGHVTPLDNRQILEKVFALEFATRGFPTACAPNPQDIARTLLVDVAETFSSFVWNRHVVTIHKFATWWDAERAGNIDFEEILRRAEETGDKHFAGQLRLIGAFGLRAREAWLFRPHLSVDALGAPHVNWGTKGGRPRKLPAALRPSQREALDRARALVPNAHASMIPPGYDLKQWSRRFYSLCKKCGFTKKQLGVTPHCLRHGVLLDLYERLAGVPAPVRGGSDTPVDPDRERDSRQVVAETAGHNRLQASSAYLGSRRHKRREAQPTTKRMPSRDDIPSNERQDAPPNEHKPRASDTD